MGELDHNQIMREFSELRERIARIEANVQHLVEALSAKGNGSELAVLEKRVQHIENSQEQIREMISQSRGVLVALGIAWPLIWPFVLQWLQGKFH